MKLRLLTFFLIGFLYSPIAVLSQDSIPIAASNLKEEKLLKFQDYFFKALAQKSIYNYRKAIQNLEQCNELKPKNIAVLFELSKNYLMQKKFLEAEIYAKEALSIDGTNVWILKHLSKIYIASKNLKAAIAIQEKLAIKNPKEKEKLVYLYFQNRQIEKAKNLLLSIEKLNQLTPNLIQFKKRFFYTAVIKKTATKENLKVLVQKFESDKSFGTLRKILTLSAQKDTTLLLSYSSIGLELFPAQAFVYYMNAKALNQKEKFQEALSQLTNGIDFVVDDKELKADFYDEMAKSYEGLGNKKAAIKNKNKALALRKKQQ